jgi:hypothetical protein
VARHGHKLLFPTNDGKEDSLPWLNRCANFFHIPAMEDVGKVFLTSFYMTGDAAQWFALLEKNHGTPMWEEFDKLVNQRFRPPIRGNTLSELIQLRHETTIVNYHTCSCLLSTVTQGSQRNIRRASSPRSSVVP